jgi:membrane-associated phospholipid phosphatase
LNLTAKLRSATRWTVTLAARVRDRLRITWVGMLALLAALLAVLASAVVLVSVSEDVIARDGMETRDASNLQLLVAHRSAWIVEAARAVTNLGVVAFLVPLSVAAAAFLWFRGARLVVAAAPLLSLGATGLAVALGKQLVNRSRPPVGLRLVSETEASFPSGHSADSAALYITLALVVAIVVLRRPLARLLVVAVAGLGVLAIGLSRLVLGVHWPTDVIVGWSLGLTVALVVTTTTVLASGQSPAEPSQGATFLRRVSFRARQLGAAHRGPDRVPGASATGDLTPGLASG